MKVKTWIALIVAALVLGSVGTAVAGSSYYWKERGISYTCQGSSVGVRCYELRSTTLRDPPKYMWLQLGQRTLFSCERRFNAGSCYDHR